MIRARCIRSAALRRLPRYPLEVFFWTRLLIWGGTLLAYLVFEAQYAQPLHNAGGAEDVVEHDVGWAVDVWGRWDSGWFLQIAHHGYADPGQLDRRSSPPTRCSCGGVGWFLLGHDLLAGVLISLARLRGRVRPPLAARRRARRRGDRRRGPFSTWRSSRRRSFCSPSTASRSTSLLSVAAFLLARRGRWGCAGRRDRARRAHTGLGGDAAARARAARLALARPARGAAAALGSRCRSWLLWPLYLWARFGQPVRVPARAAHRLGPPPLGRRPARRRLGRARRGLARRAPARRGLGPRLLPEQRPQRHVRRRPQPRAARLRRPARRPRRRRLAAPRRRLRRLRAREPGAAALRSASPARRCSRCRGSRSASFRSSSPSARSARGRGCDIGDRRRASRCCSGSTSRAGCSGSGSPERAQKSTARASRSVSNVASVTSPRSSPSACSGSGRSQRTTNESRSCAGEDARVAVERSAEAAQGQRPAPRRG